MEEVIVNGKTYFVEGSRVRELQRQLRKRDKGFRNLFYIPGKQGCYDHVPHVGYVETIPQQGDIKIDAGGYSIFSWWLVRQEGNPSFKQYQNISKTEY